MRRAIAATLLGLAGLLLLLAVLAGYLVSSESGLQLLWGQLVSATGERLTARRVEGRLIGTVHLDGVSFTSDNLRLEAGKLTLDWVPMGLLHGMLQIDRLDVRGLHYEKFGTESGTAEDAPVLPDRFALPLRIRLAALDIRDAAIITAPGGAPLVIRHVRLGGEFHGTQLRLDAVSLQMPDFAMQGRGGMQTSGVYPVEGEIDWQASPENYAGLQAHTRLGGSLQHLRLEFGLDAPYAASAVIELDRPLSELSLDASLTLEDTDLAAIQDSWPALALTATLHASGTPQELQVDASIAGSVPQTGPLNAELKGRLQPGVLHMQSLRVSAPGHDALLRASGRIEYDGPQPVVDLQANWQALSWPLQATPVVHSAGGELLLTGTADAYTLAGAAGLHVPGFASGDVRLAGQGNRQSLDLAQLEAGLLDGRLDGSGSIDWTEGVTAALTLRGVGLNPAVAWPQWPGQIDVKLQAELATRQQDWVVRFDTAQASGLLRGFPLQLDTRGHYRPGQLQLQGSRLVSGPSVLQFSGGIGSQLALAWELDSPDLATLMPGAAGRLKGQGGIHGTPATVQLQTTLAGDQLRYGEQRLDRLSLDVTIDMGGKTGSSLTLRGEAGVLAGTRMERLEVMGRGIPSAHRFDLMAVTGRGDLDIQVEGGWNTPDWTYRLTRARFTTPESGDRWQLQQPVSGLVSRAQSTLPESCWRSGRALACLQGEHTGEESGAALRIEQLPLASLLHSPVTDVGVTGTLDANARFHRRTGKPIQAQLELHTSPGQIYIDEAGDERELLAIGAGTARVEILNNRATLDASLPLAGGGGGLQAKMSIDSSARSWTERRLHGDLDIELDDITFASMLFTEVSGLHGRIDGHMNLSGTPAEPRLQGRLQVTDAGLNLASPGLMLSDIQLTLSGKQAGDLRIDGRARSGEGELTLSGQANLAGPTVALQVRGDRVQVMNTPEADIHASPDLSLKLAGNRVDVSGEVHVPYARIEPRKLPESAVTASPDQIIVSESAPPTTQPGYDIYSRVRFIMGKDVRFDGLGLSGRLQGNLLTSGKPGRPASATGEFGIEDGRYRAYGQDLDIRTGRLLFAGGPLVEPGLDVEAVRRPARDVLVGVRVRGTLPAPRLSVFSEPGMPQSRQLSWLILGRDLEQNTSDEEKSAMNEAALMLGLTGGEVLGKQLGEKVGVDEVSIESDPDAATTQASLLVGKYLSPDLFVSYGLGIFEPVSTLRMLYMLSSHWRIVGEASALRSAADIFYVIERGE